MRAKAGRRPGGRPSRTARKLAEGQRRLRLPFVPRSMQELDRLPTPALLGAGLIPAAALGWLALVHPAATGLLALLVPAAAWWQGRRVRVVWEHGIPAEVDEAPPERQPPMVPEPEVEPEAAPQPPYPVRDPLIEMVQLPGGIFWMGSDKSQDSLAGDDEGPRREARISPFVMARAPVTRGLYRSVSKESHREWGPDKDDKLPANYLSWEDAIRFCNALSQRSRRTPCYRKADAGWACHWNTDGYRLPTEAEWEYVCRAATETPWFWGAHEKEARRYAWFAGNSHYHAHPVRKKAANPWGLYDMAGNVLEWCWDRYADAYNPQDPDDPHGPSNGDGRVLRGGSFYSVPRLLRSAARSCWIVTQACRFAHSKGLPRERRRLRLSSSRKGFLRRSATPCRQRLDQSQDHSLDRSRSLSALGDRSEGRAKRGVPGIESRFSIVRGE